MYSSFFKSKKLNMAKIPDFFWRCLTISLTVLKNIGLAKGAKRGTSPLTFLGITHEIPVNKATLLEGVGVGWA